MPTLLRCTTNKAVSCASKRLSTRPETFASFARPKSVPKADPKEQKRRSAAIGRKLALLRTHGLIKKLSGTHRYVLTQKGSTTITALLTARQANINELTKIAA